MIIGAAIVSMTVCTPKGIVLEAAITAITIRTYVRFVCDPGHTSIIVVETSNLSYMADTHTPGDLFLFATRKPCQTEGCELGTTGAIWDGEHWRRTCDAHQPAFHDEIRRQRPGP
jgi:hypothetical protein